MLLNRKIQTSVSLPIPMYIEFKERAERERRAMSDVIREVIERGLDTEANSADQQREGEDEEQ